MQQESIGVVGLGLLGRGIAACFLFHGFRVVVLTKDGAPGYAAARQYIAKAAAEYLAHAGVDAEAAKDWPERFVEAAGWEAFAGCGFIVESVTEELATKQEVFDALESVVDPAVPIASNTSALPISLLQQGC